MPSLILTDTGPGYPLVQGSQSIVALGNAGGGANVLLDELGADLLDELGAQLLDET